MIINYLIFFITFYFDLSIIKLSLKLTKEKLEMKLVFHLFFYNPMHSYGQDLDNINSYYIHYNHLKKLIKNLYSVELTNHFLHFNIPNHSLYIKWIIRTSFTKCFT